MYSARSQGGDRPRPYPTTKGEGNQFVTGWVGPVPALAPLSPVTIVLRFPYKVYGFALMMF